MLKISIPGHQQLQLSHLVLDYNGTLAYDGELLPGVAERLKTMAEHLQIHVLTANTFGSVRQAMTGLAVEISILASDKQDMSKLNYVEKLGADTAVCIGNGRNDHLMLEAAALGIAVCQAEGVAVQTMLAADVITPHIQAALDLLLQPQRLVATLRI